MSETTGKVSERTYRAKRRARARDEKEALLNARTQERVEREAREERRAARSLAQCEASSHGVPRPPAPRFTGPIMLADMPAAPAPATIAPPAPAPAQLTPPAPRAETLTSEERDRAERWQDGRTALPGRSVPYVSPAPLAPLPAPEGTRVDALSEPIWDGPEGSAFGPEDSEDDCPI